MGTPHRKGLDVQFGIQFAKEYANFPESDRKKIHSFVEHLKVYGLTGLPGRNKSSDEVPTDDPQFITKCKFAQAHNLWHYHIGIPIHSTDKSFGDRTSEYVIHYINQTDNGYIVIIDMLPHPPLAMPGKQYLNF